MGETERISLDSSTLLAYQKQYHTQKRLADALFGLFRTLGSALHVERVANIGLLTLTGQLLIKCAAFFERNDNGTYRLLATVGARDPRLGTLEFPENIPPVAVLFRERTVLDLGAESSFDHPMIEKLRTHGFHSLFPLADGAEPLGIIALGEKIVPGPLTAEDLQILDAFGVVISVSLKNSVAYQLVEASRNELERLNEMKREFLSHVSHEFRTPLTILKNTFEMSEIEPEIAEMQSSALARFEHLVNSILLLNEINLHGVQLECERIHAHDWVEDRVRPMLKHQGNFDLRSELPDCTLELDVFKLGTALESVVDNAVKFGADNRGREVILYLSTRARVAAGIDAPGRDAGNLETGFLRADGRTDPRDPETLLVIEVKDCGIGIPSQELEVVFQPFTQAANSPTRGVRGAGLGLAMAKRIVDAHGGEIFCRSAVEQGTIFYIAVPATPVRGT
ncbi:MAG: ATP-binding protein [Candidatus Krumholzibacteriia bacterium]